MVFNGLDEPDRRALPARTVAWSSPRRAGSSSFFPTSRTNSYTVVADLRTQVHNFWDRGPARPRRGPGLRDEQLHLRPLHLRRADRRIRPDVGARRRHVGSLPLSSGSDDRRMRGQRPALAADRGRDRLDRERAGADQRLVPAVPEPLDRLAQLRRRRLPLRQRRRRSELRQCGLGPVRRLRGQPHAEEPLRGSPGGVGGDQTPPTAEGGALRSQSPSARPASRACSTAPCCAWTPPPAPASRATPSSRAPTRTRRRIIAYGMRNPFRFDIKPGTNDVWISDVGLQRLGGAQPPPRSHGRTRLRLALLRGHRPRVRVRRRQSHHLREPLRVRDGRRALPDLQPRRPRGRQRRLPDGQLFGGRPRLLHGRQQLPAQLHGRSRFLRLLARLHVGHLPGLRTAARTRRPPPRSPRRRRVPSTSSSGPDGNLYYVDFNGGQVLAHRVRPPRRGHGDSDERRDPAERPVRRLRFATGAVRRHPDLRLGPRRRRSVRRLDARRAPPFSTPWSAPTRSGSRSPTSAAASDISDPITIQAGGANPTATILTPAVRL